MSDLVWPVRPTVHDGSWHVGALGAVYREPTRPDQVEIGYSWHSRPTCSYCGSLSPQSLFELLSADGPLPRVTGSDWKYGWPHKFYVRGIPLPAGWEGQRTLVSYRFELGERVDVTWRDVVDDDEKFYSEHLLDLDEAAFAALAPLIHRHTGILFSVAGILGCSRLAVHAGYQA